MAVSRRDLLLTGSVSALLTGDAIAQPSAPPGDEPGKDPPLDALLAAFLLIDGRKQIENCTYAFKKLPSDRGKEIATAEIEEHEAIKKSLKALGFEYPVVPAVGKRSNQLSTWTVTAGAGKLSIEAAALVALAHEVTEQCIANFLVQMGAYADEEFERRFVSYQLDEHMALLGKVQTFRRHASLKLEAVLAGEQKVIEAHMATLKKERGELGKGAKK